ncbi:GspH/FimT family pseudopilin [Vogesella sp. DC21W]|uniref:Type II secretion system protein H n=1 Tax=Vogesella aquatica TaxID=2984206 RepID=A0ABT5IZR6_9NEIS|nr:GspH/FimT family pseudopilin [Vogesella aquatica]MDC7718066.1 GspH/FimT family pseudopilin [Vogesella aquatica]
MSRTQYGIGLLELLLVMALLLLLWTWSAAPYARFQEQQALDTQLSRIASGLMRMRSEAITRNTSVHICIANLKANLDVQGCQVVARAADGYPLAEGVLFFIDKAGGVAGGYDSKEALDVLTLPPDIQVALSSSVDRYRIRPSGVLSVHAGVSYTARGKSSGLCRRLQVWATGFRQVSDC